MDDVRLLRSSLPNEGFIQLMTKCSGNQTVCWQSLKSNAKDVVCRQLGYTGASSLVNKTTPGGVKGLFSGSIGCDGGEINISNCSINASSMNCSSLSYIKCKLIDIQRETRLQKHK